jgi:hypothetical protein
MKFGLVSAGIADYSTTISFLMISIRLCTTMKKHFPKVLVIRLLLRMVKDWIVIIWTNVRLIWMRKRSTQFINAEILFFRKIILWLFRTENKLNYSCNDHINFILLYCDGLNVIWDELNFICEELTPKTLLEMRCEEFRLIAIAIT